MAAKVDACERAIPRLEARLDVLTERVVAGSAQLAKLQNDVQMQQVRQEAKGSASSGSANSSSATQQLGILPPTTPLSLVMQNQVEELVAGRVRASEQLTMNELQKLKQRDQSAAASPQSVVDAVSSHLAHFKHEFDANQNSVLCRFTESIVKDSVRLDERVHRIETQIESLESVIEAEQQASLLALEAISDAFAGNNSNLGDSGERPATPSAHGAPPRTGGVGRRR